MGTKSNASDQPNAPAGDTWAEVRRIDAVARAMVRDGKNFGATGYEAEAQQMAQRLRTAGVKRTVADY